MQKPTITRLFDYPRKGNIQAKGVNSFQQLSQSRTTPPPLGKNIMEKGQRNDDFRLFWGFLLKLIVYGVVVGVY